jgi:hypothetical protein
MTFFNRFLGKLGMTAQQITAWVFYLISAGARCIIIFEVCGFGRGMFGEGSIEGESKWER